MKTAGALFILFVFMAAMPATSQEQVTIKRLDQKFFIRDNGVVESVWRVTMRVDKKTDAFSFYLNFGTKSYVRDLVALGPNQEPLKTAMLSSESLPLFTVFPASPIEKGEYTFTFRFVIWEAVTFIGDAGSFDFATGFLYPIETLDLVISAPPSTRILTYFPGGGESVPFNNLPAVRWALASIPAGRNLQIKLEFLRLSSSEADVIFGEALALFQARNWEASSAKFVEARDRYTLLGDSARAGECTAYLSKIKDLNEAQRLVAEADGLFAEERFSEALPKYKQASFLFNKSGLTEEAGRLTSTIEKALKYEAAQGFVSRAEDAEKKRDYVAAQGFFRNAIRIYTELGDKEKADETQKKLESIRPTPVRNIILLGALFILLLLAVIGFLLLKRRKPSPAPATAAASVPVTPPPPASDKKKAEAATQMQTCPFCGREIPKSSVTCPYCSGSLAETKEELVRRKEETEKTIDELEKSYIGGLVSEEEYKKLRKKWVTILADIEEKLISFEVKKGR